MANTYHPFTEDALTEVMNIGAQNVANALSDLTKQSVDARAHTHTFVPIEEITEIVGHPIDVTSVVLLELLGDVPGAALFLFSEENAKTLTLLLTDHLTLGNSKSLQQSALCEVGNILSGACLSAMADFLGIKMSQSIPNNAQDMLGSLIDNVLAELGTSADHALVSHVSLTIGDPPVQSSALFLFNPEATDTLFRAIRQKTPSA